MPGSRIWTEGLNATVRGSGPRWMVLGHGFGADQSSWDAQLPGLLEGGARVLRYDLAGATTHSQALFHPERHRNLFGFAEDLVALAQELGLGQAVYVGHSLGAMVGMLAANAVPGLFSRVIAIGASARYVDDPGDGYQGGLTRAEAEALLAAMGSDYVAWANGFARTVVGAPGPHFGASEFTDCLLALRPDIALGMLRATLLSDHREDVRRLRTPLYVIAARQDPVVPQPAARWLAEHGRARRLLWIDAQGHFPHMTEPGRVAEALRACLQDGGDA
ncbi:MAG: alpha/beta hydrolase [Betaproteobacteria bacterium]|nr:alpha/beta hydrolase [Betaproteobacteria bacterium]MDE1957311.1 alpha/beta hydrolase [Betaproteobacteria bacterium]MDE2152786.1 alpha/beta hydrolase [Betaproteobacteria bacterium]